MNPIEKIVLNTDEYELTDAAVREVLSGLVKIIQFTYSGTNLAANGAVNVTSSQLVTNDDVTMADAIPEGYTPVAFGNILTGNTGIVIRSIQPNLRSGATAALSIRNVTSSAIANYTITLQVIYVKSSIFAS